MQVGVAVRRAGRTAAAGAAAQQAEALAHPRQELEHLHTGGVQTKRSADDWLRDKQPEWQPSLPEHFLHAALRTQRSVAVSKQQAAVA